MWKIFDVNTKEKMTEAYSKKLEQYKESMRIYKESLTDEQKNELFRAKYEALAQKAKRKIKKVSIVVIEENSNDKFKLYFINTFVLGIKRIR